MPDFRTTIDNKLLPFVQKAIRYVGNELHSIKKDLSKVSLHGVLCFPEIYDIGMSHYGSQILYHIINSHEQWALSRCYHPWIDAEEIMRQKGIPLYSLEYFMPLIEADWLGFSIQYELQYTNLINMLDLAGIEKYSTDRTEKDPFILAGGPCMGNIEPMADFLDVCVIGDGEEVLVEICSVLEKSKQNGINRKHTLDELAEIEGVYVPQNTSVTKKGIFLIPESGNDKKQVPARKVKKLSDDHYPIKPMVPLIETVHHRFAVEVMRGCTRGCRFCAAGMFYRPVRERSVSSIVNQIKKGLDASGWKDVGLLSLSTADYSCFGSLAYNLGQELKNRYVKVSLPSTRIDALSDDELKAMNTLFPAKTFTIAPEAGSQRLRNSINKDFSEDTILDMVHTLLENNIQTIKLYFMIGLPGETDDDIDAIIKLVSKISAIVREKAKRRSINVSVSPFSPKAHTPFQWDAMEDSLSLMNKGRKIKYELKYRKNVSVSYRDPGMTFLESVFARGDRSLSAVVFNAWKRGARFDGWDEHFDLERWKDAAKDSNISLDLFTQKISEEQILPWSYIDVGVTDEFLLRERKKAISEQVSADCRNDVCINCGACGQVKPDYVTSLPMNIPKTEEISLQKSKKPEKEVETITFFYRVEYFKNRDMRFLSHRNIVNMFHRALQTAKIPVAYSQGFHPQPRIAFGPPLAVGVMGEKELFDIRTTEPIPLDYSAINALLPNGLKITSMVHYEKKQDSISASIAAALYTFIPVFDINHEQLEHVIHNKMKQTTLAVSVEKKGKLSQKDIKPLIHELSVNRENDTFKIEVVLSALPKQTCRPLDFIRCFFPQKELSDFIMTRVSCLKKNNNKLVRII